MSTKTAIQWTDHTFNVAWGCEKISPGCAGCYALKLATRYGFDVWGKDKPRRLFGAKHWNEPLAWNRAAQKAGVPSLVFTSSMADAYEAHPQIDEERETKLWPLIRATPWLEWQILTKRAERMSRLWPKDPPPNAWAGVSVESDKYLGRLDWLRNVNARIRFVSFEPLLGPLGAVNLDGISWAIVGGESGPEARPMHPAWARSLIAACKAAGVACFMKQEGAWTPRRPANFCRVTKSRHSHESVGMFPDGTFYESDKPDTYGANGYETLYRHGGHNADPSEWPEDLRVREFPPKP